jgi:hypothetical protein
VGTWNEKILPPEVKEQYDASRDANRILSCALICSPHNYPADDGTTGHITGSMMVLVLHTSMTYWHPAISGALIDSDGKFLQPNFNPEGCVK